MVYMVLCAMYFAARADVVSLIQGRGGPCTGISASQWIAPVAVRAVAMLRVPSLLPVLPLRPLVDVDLEKSE